MAMGRMGESFTEINVTPLTDVFLVLLVIMILVAPLANQTVLKVTPPPASHRTPTTPPPPADKNTINVNVSAQGVVTINELPVQPASTATIQKRIESAQEKAGSKDIPLDLQCDDDAIQKYVVAVMDAAAGAGIQKLHVLPLRKSK